MLLTCIQTTADAAVRMFAFPQPKLPIESALFIIHCLKSSNWDAERKQSDTGDRSHDRKNEE